MDGLNLFHRFATRRGVASPLPWPWLAPGQMLLALELRQGKDIVVLDPFAAV